MASYKTKIARLNALLDAQAEVVQVYATEVQQLEHWKQTVSEFLSSPAAARAELWGKLLAEFPLFDDDSLCQEKHHCEWTLQQDRKRLHAVLQSAEATR